MSKEIINTETKTAPATKVVGVDALVMWFFTGRTVSHIFLTDEKKVGKIVCGARFKHIVGGFQENILPDRAIGKQISCKKCIKWFNSKNHITDNITCAK